MDQRFPKVPDLIECLRRLLAQVPSGRVATCVDLADALGNRIAARWVGHYALHHAHDADCLCHRVVRLGGLLGGYAAGSVEDKLARLVQEGVAVEPSESLPAVVDLERSGYRAFVSDRPLERLRKLQEEIQKRIVIRPRRRLPRLAGGVDVAYPNAEEGVAAYALVATATGELVWSATLRRRVVFPYISSYLSFREIPILLELFEKVRAADRMAEVVLVDGSGILHHRQAGIASHLGVVAELPTVGVIKKLLCGKADIRGMTPGESRPVWSRQTTAEGSRPEQPASFAEHLDEQLIGVALRPTAGSLRPIYISPGHRVDVPFSERLVRALLHGRRLPAPIYWADRLSRQEARPTPRSAPR